jgi:hypothetical protein
LAGDAAEALQSLGAGGGQLALPGGGTLGNAVAVAPATVAGVSTTSVVTVAATAMGTNVLMTSGGEGSGSGGGLVRGRPEVPPGSQRLRRDVRKPNSEEFKRFLESQGISRKGWHYVMETWRTPSGQTIERHFWEGPSGLAYWHR